MSSDTPLTDEAALGLGRLLIEPNKATWTELVDSNFARQLERDLATARQQLAEWQRRSESCESKVGQLEANELVDDLRQQLAERDALIERMRDALIECLDDSHQVLSEYEQLYSATYRPQRLEAQKTIVSEAQAVLALTPPQALAAHDTEVRRKALEEVVALWDAPYAGETFICKLRRMAKGG